MVTPSRSFTTSTPCEPRGRRLMQKVWAFVRGCLLLLGKGSKLYYAWLSALMVLIAIGVFAYANHWKPIKEIAILGELVAVSAMVVCLLFVTVDIGRPDRFWHLIPKIGILNFPQSLLAWDVVVLNTYLVLNFGIASYMLYSYYYRREPNMKYVFPLLMFSIPAAISIHTVTAFLYNGLAAKPFWNASILAPRFLAP